MLGYHGCDRRVGEQLLAGTPFQQSNNDYDWLGPGVYFWEANPRRGLEFAAEQARRKAQEKTEPFVVGAVIDLGLCLDLMAASSVEWLKLAYRALAEVSMAADLELPLNSADQLRRNLDCAVVRRLHSLREEQGLSGIDTVRGIFTEGEPVYPGAGFREKTHVQIAVRNPECIKGVFRVPADALNR